MIGAAALLFFYGLAFYAAIINTEHVNSFRRISLVAPFHFKQFDPQKSQKIQIDPLLTIYSEYQLLPENIKVKLDNNWVGEQNFHFEDDSEFSVLAQYENNNEKKIVYAIENIRVVEWGDLSYVIMQFILFTLGLFLFVIAAGFIVKTASRIAAPFTSIVEQLDGELRSEFKQLTISGEQSLELVQTITAINNYRQKIETLVSREKSFTRYISHELRTPMTVIRGRISILKKHGDPYVCQQLSKMKHALDETEQLTQTFLLLARDKTSKTTTTSVDISFIDNVAESLEPIIQANNVSFHYSLQQEFVLPSEPLLISAILQNLLTNSIKCSINGDVTLSISKRKIVVLDNGLGLESKPRGYEGFGIGLQLVRDICDRYDWSFQITNNSDIGCTASILLE